MTNCQNCGAPLDGTGRCAYCGTTFKKPMRTLPPATGMIECTTLGDTTRSYISAPFDSTGKLIVDGCELDVVITEIKSEDIYDTWDCGRTIDGQIVRTRSRTEWTIVCTACV